MRIFNLSIFAVSFSGCGNDSASSPTYEEDTNSIAPLNENLHGPLSVQSTDLNIPESTSPNIQPSGGNPTSPNIQPPGGNPTSPNIQPPGGNPTSANIQPPGGNPAPHNANRRLGPDSSIDSGLGTDGGANQRTDSGVDSVLGTDGGAHRRSDSGADSVLGTDGGGAGGGGEVLTLRFTIYPPNEEAMRIINSMALSTADSISVPTEQAITAFQESKCPEQPVEEYKERDVEDPLEIPFSLDSTTIAGSLVEYDDVSSIKNMNTMSLDGNYNWSHLDYLRRLIRIYGNSANFLNGRPRVDLWYLIRGRWLIQSLVNPLPNTRPYEFDCPGEGTEHPSICFLVMSMATTILVPMTELSTLTDTRAVEIANAIRLTEFCRLFADKIQRNIMEFFASPPRRNSWEREPSESEKIIKKEFLGRWLKFCPNLNTPEIRVSRINAFKWLLPERMLYYRIEGVDREHPFLSVREIFIRNATAGQLIVRDLRVVFSSGEDGITDEWFDGVMREIFDPQTGIFIEPARGEYMKLIPVAVNDPNREEKLEIIEDAGKMIAATLASGRQIMYPLSLPLLAKLLGKIIAWESMNTVDNNRCKDIARLVIVRQTNAPVRYPESLRILETDAANWPIEEDKRSALMDIAISNKSTFDAEDELEAFSRGFFSIIPKGAVKESGLRATDLRLLAFGPERIDVQNLINTWALSGSCLSNWGYWDRAFDWLREIISGWNENQLRQFIKFISGRPQIPMEGFTARTFMSDRGFRIRIECRRIPSGSLTPDELRPRADVSQNSIELYRYSSMEIMRDRILEAIADN